MRGLSWLHGFAAAAWATVVATFSPATAVSQAAAPAPGQTVRVTARAAGMDHEPAEFVGTSGDTVVLLRTVYVPREPVVGVDTVRVRVALASVENLEVRYRGGSLAMPGALLGALLGSSAGASIGRHSGYSPCGFWFFFCFEESPSEKATIYGIIGGILGAGTGAMLGMLTSLEGWRDVPLERLRVAVAPAGVGVGVRLSVAF